MKTKVNGERPIKGIPKDRSGLVCQGKTENQDWLVSARKKEDVRLGGEKRKMESEITEVTEKKHNIYFRLSKKKNHVYGFVPEGGLSEGECIVISVKSSEFEGKQFAGLIAVMKETAEFTRGAVLPPNEEGN